MKPIWINVKQRAMKPNAIKALYLRLIPTVKSIARANGYAIGVHGSLKRDCDLIAVPWTLKAISPEFLASRIHKAISKYWHSPSSIKKQAGGSKPHGRRAYVLHLGTHASGTRHPKAIYIDLSIMPRAGK